MCWRTGSFLYVYVCTLSSVKLGLVFDSILPPFQTCLVAKVASGTQRGSLGANTGTKYDDEYRSIEEYISLTLLCGFPP